jgi:hypothetical protein
MNPSFQSFSPVGRSVEFEGITQTFASDGDLMLAGVTGSGRRTLIRYAAREIGARVLELDCLRANTSERFLRLLAEELVALFGAAPERQLMEQWARQNPVVWMQDGHRAKLNWSSSGKDSWSVFQTLLTLPQVLAEQLNCRVVFMFQNFPHIRSWDRSNSWEAYLREEIQRQSHVSYAIVATVPEEWAYQSNLKVISLGPLPRSILAEWVLDVMMAHGLKVKADALDLFLDSVQGHIGDASALARRIWVESRATQELEPWSGSPRLAAPWPVIELDQVHRSTQGLIEDLSTTFESLLLLLPPIQARVLESLAIDPTERPHAREYLQKHQLSKGGGLQGALASLCQKGLIYGSREKYQIALPLFRLWLKQRIA